jgi:hypothetical protein
MPASEAGDGGGNPAATGAPSAGFRWGWRLLLFLSLLFALTAVVGRAVSWLAGPPSGIGDAALFGLASALPAAVVATWVMMSCVESRPLASLGLRPRHAPGRLVAGAGIGAVLIGVLLALFAVAGWARWEVTPDVGAAGFRALSGTALFLGLAAFLEELLFRGYPFRLLAERFGARPAIAVTSTAFAAAHAANPGVGVVALANTALAGILLGVLYWRTLSLWLVTGAHFGWNATLSVLADLPVSGLELPAPGIRASLSGPEILTGGAYGPEGGLALLFVLLPAIAWAAGTRRLRREESDPAPNPLPGRRVT